MPTEIIGMYGTGSGSADAAAQIDIPQDGVITGVDMDHRATMDADGENSNMELSFIATRQLVANDVRGRIASSSMEMHILTSGIAVASAQKFVGPMDLPVAGGERLYMHFAATSGVSSTGRINVHLDVSGQGITRRSARRR